MAREADISARIGSLGELAEIVAAIRAIAASQMQQALRSIEAIQRYSDLVGEALFDAAALLPDPVTVGSFTDRTALVLFGAEHGFCGAFNQAPVRAAQQGLGKRAEKPVLIAVGSRVARLCREHGLQSDLALPMATHYAGVNGTARRVAAELYRMFGEHQLGSVAVIYVAHNARQILKIERRKILPLDLPTGKTRPSRFPPVINLRPRQLLDGIIGEYLFAALENAALQSFFSENSTRFRTMEAAHQNIQKKISELTKLVRRMRQEAITSETLDLISGAEALS